MKKTFFLIIALFLVVQMPLSAKEKPGKIITYTVIRKHGGPLGYAIVKSRIRSSDHSFTVTLECYGWGFKPCKMNYIQVSDEYLHVQDVIAEKVNEMLEYCDIQVSNQIYNGEYSKKIYVTSPSDKHNRILILRMKWQMQNSSTDGVINIFVEETNKIKLF